MKLLLVTRHYTKILALVQARVKILLRFLASRKIPLI